MQVSCRDLTCPKCGGWLEGHEDGDDWACDTCDYVSNEQKNRKKMFKSHTTCPICRGSGNVRINGIIVYDRPSKITKICNECNGSGKIITEK